MIEIKKPSDIGNENLQQIIDIIKNGNEVNTTRDKLKEYLLRADIIAYKFSDNAIISTASLKNPFPSYRTKVFKLAKSKCDYKNYNKELGYIATHPKFENKGHCSELLRNIYKCICDNSMYATTRKPAIIHILGKFQFRKIGDEFNSGLNLLVYDTK